MNSYELIFDRLRRLKYERTRSAVPIGLSILEKAWLNRERTQKNYTRIEPHRSQFENRMVDGEVKHSETMYEVQFRSGGVWNTVATTDRLSEARKALPGVEDVRKRIIKHTLEVVK